MMVFVPGESRDVLLKSKLPCRYVYDDKRGLTRAVQSMFRVSSACSLTRSHNWRGDSLSVVHSLVMSWFLNVQIARSTTLTCLLYGSTNWKSVLFCVMIFCTLTEHSLPRISRFGGMPLFLQHL